MIGIKYDKTTGKIVGTIKAVLREDFEATAANIKNTYGFIEINASHELLSDVRRWRVDLSGPEPVPVPRSPVTLTASKREIVSDGLDECIIAVSGHTSDIAFAINRDLVQFPANESELILTSDMPRTMRVKLVSDIYYADELTVVAR